MLTLRSAVNPQNFLKGFKGTTITDGYHEYSNIDGVINAFCWVNVRRHFCDWYYINISGWLNIRILLILTKWLIIAFIYIWRQIITMWMNPKQHYKILPDIQISNYKHDYNPLFWICSTILYNQVILTNIGKGKSYFNFYIVFAVL